MYHNNNITRSINFIYNSIFKYLNNISIDLEDGGDKETLKRLNSQNSKGLGTVWLLNLKRLYKIFIKNNYDEKKYHFLDIGCGNGIPLIYAYKRFKFKSYSGFDFEKKYVENSKKNLKSSIKNECTINIFHQNAENYILHENKPFFIFMFNPFNKLIMKKFLENNIKILIKNKSVIAYCNCLELDEIKNFCNNITLVKKYKLALIRF